MESRIKQLREKRGLIQEILAAELGITQQMLSKYERDITLIKVDILKKIAAYFNVTTDYLLGISEIKRDLQGQMQMNETLDEYYDLVEVYKELRNTLKSKEADVQKGINAVLESLLAPLKQIAENAGYEGDEIVSKQLKAKENVGFNAKTGKWVDMYEAGVVDPAKVARSAILNASSISALFLTTEAAVTEIKEDKPAPVPQVPEY